MAYCKGFPGAKELRQRLCQVDSEVAVELLAEFCLHRSAETENAEQVRI